MPKAKVTAIEERPITERHVWKVPMAAAFVLDGATLNIQISVGVVIPADVTVSFEKSPRTLD